jgi:hypothetical protein
LVRFDPVATGNGLNKICQTPSDIQTLDNIYSYAPGTLVTMNAGIYWVYQVCDSPIALNLARSKPTEGLKLSENKALGGKPLIVFPNPSHGTSTALFKTAAEGQVTLRIYNLSGSLVRTQDLGELAPGIHQQVLQADGFASGLYLVQLELTGPGGTQSLGLFKWALVK